MYPQCITAPWDAPVFLFETENIDWRVQLDEEKRMFMQITNSRKKTASHNTQTCDAWQQFLSADWLFMAHFPVTFQTTTENALSFLITFLSTVACAYLVIFEFPLVACCFLSCFLGETISDTFNLPIIISHSSWIWVCCMLSWRISRIGLLIVSKMTENPMANYGKILVWCNPVD